MTDNCNDIDFIDINFVVCGTKLVRTDTNPITTHSVKRFNAYFEYKTGTFMWNNQVHKYAIFSSETGENYCVDFGNDIGQSDCYIPAKVLEGDFFRVTLMGINEESGMREVTNPVTVHLVRSGFTENLQAYDPDLDNGDIFSQLRELINNCLCDVRVEGNQLLFIKENTVYYRFTITNHQHTSSQITDLEDTIGLEIKRGYQVLVNKIRTYGE